MLGLQLPLALAAAAAAYLTTVRVLRYRRINTTIKRLGYEGLTSAQIYDKITLTDAQAVQTQLSLLEFPKMMYVSLQFALFKTYAFPYMSATLVKSGQLGTPKPAPKRYVDTVVLVAEWMRWPLDSERASLAIARTNYLHAQYAQYIKPDDFLYTLILFATEPLIFISKYEWRQPTELEKASCWRFWYEVGVRMNVPPETIPKTWDAMAQYAREFDEKMEPAESNHQVGTVTLDLLLWWCPGFATGFVKMCVCSVMGEPLRKAMVFPEVHPVIPPIVNTVIALRRFYLRHLSLPRSRPLERLSPRANPETGRYNIDIYDVDPWYVPATYSNSFWSWYAWATGRPFIQKGKYSEGGYLIEEVGPKLFEGKGMENVKNDAERIRKMGVGAGGSGACPFKL
ncbi:hypothetical protein DFP73DRAFT_129470 [Morchella snyderi]|nr:hypothetical protein DFP73DRAFT_129470 [Morchella snyderi]